MFKKLPFLFLFVIFLVQMASAQTGSITGTVTNEKGVPVPTADVLLVEISREAATNLQGKYLIEDVLPGTYTLRVSFIGYETYEDPVTIEAGQILTKDVVLQEKATGSDEKKGTGNGKDKSPV